MGATKSELFTFNQNELAAIAKALAHPARIAILQHLLKVNACISSDIVEELPLAQATVSQHLKELKAVGLIQGTIEGVTINYCIDAARWREVQSLLNGLFEGPLKDMNCC